MKKWLAAMIVLIVLGLDWAAFHDILKGEPDTTAEWLMIDVSALLLAVLTFLFVRNRAAKTRT